MLKKSITYTDLNGDTQTDDFYFHMSKAELIEMEVSHKGGMSEFLQKISKSNDGKAIITEFKEIILGAYGQRSEDGKRFYKNQALRDEFESSEAYSALFFELCTKADAAAAFVNGIVPDGLDKEMARVARVEGHPSDTAAKMAEPLHNESMAERVSDETSGATGGPLTAEEARRITRRNVFENDRVGDPDIPEAAGPRVLSHREAVDMDPDELRSGLATGRYTLS